MFAAEREAARRQHDRDPLETPRTAVDGRHIIIHAREAPGTLR
jgi:hypothetical protein